MLNISLTQLIIDFTIFYTDIYSGLDVNESVNLRINLIFVGAFHPKCITLSIEQYQTGLVSV